MKRKTKLTGVDAVESKNRILIKCKQCGEKFSIPICHAKRGSKFCSSSCFKQYEVDRKKKKMIPCFYCGNDFLPPRVTSKYCSIKCVKDHQYSERKKRKRTCLNCGSIFFTTSEKIRLGFGLFCNKKCRYTYMVGENHPTWKGGTIDSSGYKQVYVKGKIVRDHRIVYEEHHGVSLSSNDVIHHKNGVKNDNRIENLQLMTRSEHTSLHAQIKPKAILKFWCSI